MQIIKEYFAQDGQPEAFNAGKIEGCPYYVGSVKSVIRGNPDIPCFFIGGDLDCHSRPVIEKALTQLKVKGYYIFATGFEVIQIANVQFFRVTSDRKRIIDYSIDYV
jgi:hypothetical protein